MTWTYSKDCKRNTFLRQNQQLHRLKVGTLEHEAFTLAGLSIPGLRGGLVSLNGDCHSAFWLSQFSEEPVTTKTKALGENSSPQQHLLDSARFLTLNEALPSLSSSCMNTVLGLKASQQKCYSHKNSGCGNGQFSLLETYSKIITLSNELKLCQHSQVQYNTHPFFLSDKTKYTHTGWPKF